MKNTIKYFINILIITLLLSSCGPEDEPRQNANRGAEKIEVYLNGSSTPLTFNDNIVAKDYPIPATTGYSNQFIISSEDTVTGNKFWLNFGSSFTPAPFTVTVPSTETLSGAVTNRLKIDGINFDDAAANSLTITYTTFDTNTGGEIDLNINGTYYEISNTSPKSVNINIHVHRD
ncbi:hypothetical protein [Aestuariibaculum sediminum]|uniref:Uncharacterized protein n=1 Tax=Aestuariibaculum sediminum TaxID=2770637 RepID=A0A8J6UBU2_9FLAO|nr:hypothetical protein [Aestuariibaculum sediminum]MBD0831404.1 hypothetical protein [Aestuariibaculum sediminum]